MLKKIVSHILLIDKIKNFDIKIIFESNSTLLEKKIIKIFLFYKIMKYLVNYNYSL